VGVVVGGVIEVGVGADWQVLFRPCPTQRFEQQSLFLLHAAGGSWQIGEVVGVPAGVAVGVAVDVEVGVELGVGVAVGVSVGAGITLTMALLNSTPSITRPLPSSSAAPGPKNAIIVASPRPSAWSVIWPMTNGVSGAIGASAAASN